MEKYRTVRSPFIRTLLGRTSWREREYVDDLISLDGLIDCPHRSFAGGVHFHQLKERHPSEYLLLLRERGEEQYLRGMQELRERSVRESESRRSLHTKETLLREDWLRAGGQP